MADSESTSGTNDARLWRWLEQAANESARVRRDQGQFDRVDRWMDLYHGKHFPDTMPSYRPPVVVNELRTLLLTEASDLSDVGFRPYVMKDPRRGTRDQQAEHALRAAWVHQQVELKLIEATLWAEAIGTGFMRVSWDPDLFYGLGDIEVESVEPRAILPDPDAPNDRRWQFVIVESVLDLSEIRRLFPQKGWMVKPEDPFSETSGVELFRDRAPMSLQPGPSYAGPLASGDSLTGLGSYPGYKKARARVLDCTVKDDTHEEGVELRVDPDEKPILDADGNQVYEQVRRMKYPRGRRIVGANGIILYDGPNTNPGGDFGILRVTLEPTLGRFWGTGFIQQTGELQLAADKLVSAVVENAIRLNNGMMVATGNTGLDFESFASIPGQILQINQGAALDIKYPPAMPNDMIEAPWRLLDAQRRVLGFPDPRVGTGGRGNVSPDLTETEISQSQSVTRLRAKHLYFVVQRLAEMMFARMAMGYTTPRSIPAVEGEQFAPVKWEPLDNPEKYAIYIDPASFQIMSRSMLRRMSLMLYKMGAIDRRAVLESVGWPDYEETSRRLDEAERLAALAKMKSRSRNK